MLGSAAFLAAQQPAPSLPAPRTTAAPGQRAAPGQAMSLDDLVQHAIAQHPILAQAQFEIEAAEARALQAGKYPNPTVTVGGEEIGPRAGIHTLPLVSQEIVTAKKLRWARAVAEREVDQTFLALASKRFVLVTAVRKAFVDVITAERRRDVLTARLKEVEKALEEAKKRVQVLPEEGSEIVPLTFQYELDRIALELATSEREYTAAWTRLAAVVGSPGLEAPSAIASPFLDRLPVYAVNPDARKSQQNLTDLRQYVIGNHPEVRFAEVGIAKAEAALGRERAHAVPNITLAGGYQRNFNDRAHQATYQVEVPIPLFNRNKDNIRAAQAEYGRAVREVERIELDLSQRLAVAYGEYTTAKLRAAESNRLRAMSKKIYDQASTLYFKAGKLSNFQIIQYQRQMIDAELEYIRAWGDAWRAASEIAGLLLDEDWLGTGNNKN